MAYLAWIASELGSATNFPKANIIPQKPQRDGSGGIAEPVDGCDSVRANEMDVLFAKKCRKSG